MESILQELVDSLKSSSRQLAQEKHLFQAALHDTDRLPSQKLSSLASQALDLLSEIRLSLEPAHVLLADQFLGTVSRTISSSIFTHEGLESDYPQVIQVQKCYTRQSS